MGRGSQRLRIDYIKSISNNEIVRFSRLIRVSVCGGRQRKQASDTEHNCDCDRFHCKLCAEMLHCRNAIRPVYYTHTLARLDLCIWLHCQVCVAEMARRWLCQMGITRICDTSCSANLDVDGCRRNGGKLWRYTYRLGSAQSPNSTQQLHSIETN